jgi:hypothetical protein
MAPLVAFVSRMGSKRDRLTNLDAAARDASVLSGRKLARRAAG